MFKRLFINILSLLCFTSVYGQDVASSIKTAAAEIKTLTANFKQLRVLAVMTKPAESSGKLYYKTSDKVRWEQTAPSNMIVTFNNTQTAIRDQNGSIKTFSTSSNRIFRALSDIISGGISGRIFDDHTNYSVIFDTNNEGKNRARLTPKNSGLSKFIKSFEVMFDKRFLACRIVINEQSGDQTIIELNNTQINTPLSDSLFNQK